MDSLLQLLLGLLILTSTTSSFGKPPNAHFGGDSQLGTLLGSFRDGFNISNLMWSLQAPTCVRECISELKIPMGEVLLTDLRSPLEQTKRICSDFDSLQLCIKKKPKCNAAVLEIVTTAFSQLCNGNQDALVGLLPCIRSSAMNIQSRCESDCKLGTILMHASTLNTKLTNVINLRDQDGNKILSIPDLHTLCNSSACFLDCMHKSIEEKCPYGSSNLIESIFGNVLSRALGKVPIGKTSAADAYTALVSSILPKQCNQLKASPISRDIVLSTTRIPLQIPRPPVDNHLSNVQQDDRELASKKAGSEEALSIAMPAVWDNFFERSLRIDGHKANIQCRVLDADRMITLAVPNVNKLLTILSMEMLRSSGVRLNDLFARRGLYKGSPANETRTKEDSSNRPQENEKLKSVAVSESSPLGGLPSLTSALIICFLVYLQNFIL